MRDDYKDYERSFANTSLKYHFVKLRLEMCLSKFISQCKTGKIRVLMNIFVKNDIFLSLTAIILHSTLTFFTFEKIFSVY